MNEKNPSALPKARAQPQAQRAIIPVLLLDEVLSLETKSPSTKNPTLPLPA
jgi:hypothetical protein